VTSVKAARDKIVADDSQEFVRDDIDLFGRQCHCIDEQLNAHWILLVNPSRTLDDIEEILESRTVCAPRTRVHVRYLIEIDIDIFMLQLIDPVDMNESIVCFAVDDGQQKCTQLIIVGLDAETQFEVVQRTQPVTADHSFGRETTNGIATSTGRTHESNSPVSQNVLMLTEYMFVLFVSANSCAQVERCRLKVDDRW
jgi:hypothetical protein